MPDFDYTTLASVQFFCIGYSFLWMIQRNDEIPLLVSSLLYYVASYRYWAVTHDLGGWVRLENFGIPTITDELALAALPYIVLGEICFLGSYWLRQSKKIPVLILKKNELSFFITWLRPKLLIFGLLCLPLVLLTRGSVSSQVESGRQLSLQVSGYLYQFPFVLVGIATLVLCVWKFRGFPQLWHKVAAIAILIGVGQLSFQLSGRFQFLGILATAAIVLSSSFKPLKRLALLSVFVAIAISLFAVAGAMRGDISDGETQGAATNRLISAEDANMLDGMVILVYAVPDLAPYSYGKGHLEILMRPIPRKIWPGKPIGGGYMLAAGLINLDTGQTVGISPTMFGDFYSEGGILGIIFFGTLYGLGFASIIRWSVTLNPFTCTLIRAMVCASLIPVLRGGDLPGIAAWLGMAFWPCFLVVKFKWKDLGPQRKININPCPATNNPI